jgi:hypothetical protein
MLLRVHAAALPVPWSTVIRDQVPKRNRLPTWEIMRPSKSTMQKNLHAFYNDGIFSQHDIMYISYNTLLCLPCRGPDLDHAAELDSTPTSWLPQQSLTTTSTLRERSTTCHRLQRLLIGFDSK